MSEAQNSEPLTVHQDDLPALTKKVRADAGLTQQEEADRLGVAKSSVSRVERYAGGRYLNLQKRILSEIGGFALRGPLWEITSEGKPIAESDEGR